MTLTELKYMIAVARERHFGRAAETCFVSQPTLSLAIKKLEDELGVTIFERGGAEIGITPTGRRLITQAQKILEESNAFKEIARQGSDPLSGVLQVGVIHTVGPYLLPHLIPVHIKRTPQMPLILQENYTLRLLELLHQGEIDCAILAAPVPDTSLECLPLYTEDFVVAVPNTHRWAGRTVIASAELKNEPMLLLGMGHCFREHVLEVCPEMTRFAVAGEGIQRSFEGSSLETIRHMVAVGLGVTLLPKSAVTSKNHELISDEGAVVFIPLEKPVPNREVVLVWRRSFTRPTAIDALAQSIYASHIPGVNMQEKGSTKAILS